LAYDPYVNSKQAAELGVRLGALEDVMARPVVSIHLPQLPATKGLISREQLARLPDDAILINSSRGSVIDEDALIDELSAGRIRAALDVYETEPLPKTNLMRKLPNVFLTPHIAGATEQGHLSLMRCVVEDIINAAEGRPTCCEVNPKRWEILA
jgi:phosphoglycerate dehydrogenase-like enzyme